MAGLDGSRMVFEGVSQALEVVQVYGVRSLESAHIFLDLFVGVISLRAEYNEHGTRSE